MLNYVHAYLFVEMRPDKLVKAVHYDLFLGWVHHLALQIPVLADILLSAVPTSSRSQ